VIRDAVPRRTLPRPASGLLSAALVASVALLAGLPPAAAAPADDAPVLLLRADDVGMSHAVNSAVRRLLETGLPFSASVMTATPWYLEAVEILRDQPRVSVGIHLTLNSEWQHLKWGPVLGASAVPTLVDENGHFHATNAAFAAAAVDPGEVRRELRAQIERARRAGLDVDYLDYHMLTALSTPALRAVVEELAAEYGLGLSRYFDERSASLWDTEPDRKLTELLAVTARLEGGRPNLVVIHLGLETPEMSALVDTNNPADPYRVARHRQAELDALTSPAFRRAIDERGIELVTYGELIERMGLEAMRAPASAGYSMGDDSQ
jgi:predicted glycoside hydrolase/deacetylase ChbG (UPF0249 family)